MPEPPRHPDRTAGGSFHLPRHSTSFRLTPDNLPGGESVRHGLFWREKRKLRRRRRLLQGACLLLLLLLALGIIHEFTL